MFTYAYRCTQLDWKYKKGEKKIKEKGPKHFALGHLFLWGTVFNEGKNAYRVSKYYRIVDLCLQEVVSA